MSMFCYQCQETAGCKGCSIVGVCGKTSDVANLQDLLIYIVKGIAMYDLKAEKSGIKNREVNKFMMDSLFSTITNANFNKEDFIVRIKNALKLREIIKEKLLKNNIQIDDIKDDCALWIGNSVDEFEVKAPTVGILSTENEDVRSLRELLTYGIKGMAAYAHHAYNLGYEDELIYTFMKKALVSTTKSLSVDEMIKIVLECGKFGVDVMALLDKANTETYGNPEITKVNIGVRNNPAILISGHDLKDMEELLKQTEGTGVDVYTHSEMLPANYYPAFKKYNHFVGNYGNAWWKQNEEFESFNGPILMTTNCLIPPKESYKRRVYTTGAVSFNGVNHIEDRRDGDGKDFSEIIEHAKKCAPPIEIEKGEIIGGFAHNAVLSLADKIVDAVRKGDIKKFFVMAGCDGRAKTRNYYSDFAKALPQDTVILTAGCAKYKYNKLNLGDIDGIPRVLDAGQCNDSYSLAVIALKLKEVFELDDINKLPISFNISWYEQKAVIVLLALLHLGVKNIHLGPTLPAFLSPNVTKVLVNKFGIAGIGTVDEDIKLFLGEA
ncbi:hydroxylamine reductase [Clostridium botulinum]|uniref:Hydroxylamine reductase n=3 Tax=Clostridium botulinum TaxID=1491 RepID=A0A0A0IIQ0_CLOBO|nr:hydroxylamine reductase [Clostridium botulinum]KEI00362.1 hydroxylamine reductase [Clostridium botulinum C/D str. BKT75002]KEI08983.1 hydroxylamine reductase [Clostridium botulinum C/D str. BKT2873]KGM93669.1 hydroxylamine reductase [Clostridium botulinum D str. CCUG 7971]KGM99455.1 hydroxylamine reductase [Clostridium botulinum C/D str. DC5]KOC47805.1 hydroxylamine reductase [Clostridium botulinum]